MNLPWACQVVASGLTPWLKCWDPSNRQNEGRSNRTKTLMWGWTILSMLRHVRDYAGEGSHLTFISTMLDQVSVHMIRLQCYWHGFSILTPTMLSATQMIPRAACAAGFPHSLYAVTFTVPLNSSVLYIALPSFPSCPNTLAFPTIHRVIMIWLSVMPSMPGMRPRWSLYMDGPTSVTMVCAWSWPTSFSSASSTVCLTTKSGQSRT